MTYGSICSGIEAATVAWEPLGWRPAFFAEVDAFPSAVLAHHYPGVRNLGDFTRIQPDDAEPIDLLVGGTPCQSFSVAGRRAGLDDPRGVLTLEFLCLAGRLRPRWLVWENVPNVLSDDEGRTFGTILGTLAELGYGFAYRVFDAQFFRVAQQRRRVFVVAHAGGLWQCAAAVLSEQAALSQPARPSRRSFGCAAAGADDGAGSAVAYNLRGRVGGSDMEGPMPVAAALRAGHGSSSRSYVVGSFAENQRHELRTGEVVSGLFCGGGKPGRGYPAVHRVHGTGKTSRVASATDVVGALRTKRPGSQENSSTDVVLDQAWVRKLTPRECERLQGFPDDYTLIRYRGKPAADSPRYKAIGNSMAVPVMRWIGERIQQVDALSAPGFSAKP